jgi:hypothetical protein
MLKGNSGPYYETDNWKGLNSEGSFPLADTYWIFTHPHINWLLKLMVDSITKKKAKGEMN